MCVGGRAVLFYSNDYCLRGSLAMGNFGERAFSTKEEH